jgi:hypothetical protein
LSCARRQCVVSAAPDAQATAMSATCAAAASRTVRNATLRTWRSTSLMGFGINSTQPACAHLERSSSLHDAVSAYRHERSAPPVSARKRRAIRALRHRRLRARLRPARLRRALRHRRLPRVRANGKCANGNVSTSRGAARTTIGADGRIPSAARPRIARVAVKPSMMGLRRHMQHASEQSNTRPACQCGDRHSHVQVHENEIKDVCNRAQSEERA